MFEAMKKGFGLTLGYLAALGAGKLVAVILFGDPKSKESKGKHEAN